MTAESILTLIQLGINTEEKSELYKTKETDQMDTKSIRIYHAICNKEQEERKTTLEDLIFLLRSLKVMVLVWDMLLVLGSSKKLTSGATSKNNGHHRM